MVLECLPRRLIMAFMGIMAIVNVYVSRNNVTIAIIRMVNQTALDLADAKSDHSFNKSVCYGNSAGTSDLNEPSTMDGPLILSQSQQGTLLACYYWGYTANQLTAGYFAYRFGFKLALGIGIGVGALLTIAFPYVLLIPTYGYHLAVIIRILTGFFHAPAFPAMQGAWTKWAPSSEKVRLVGAHFAGGPIGTFFITLIGGFIGQTFGWEPIFVFSGVLNLVFIVFWYLLVYDSPEEHPFITDSERDYIISTRSKIIKKESNENVPYRQILTSGPVWAMIACHSVGNWGFYTIINLMPKFMSDYQGKNIKKIGYMASLPYFLQTFTVLLATATADFLQNKFHIRKVYVRKGFVVACTVFPAAGLLLMTTAECNELISVAFAITIQFFFAFNIAGAKCNPNDIGPQYASIIMSVANMFGNIPGFVSPIIAGELLETYGRGSKWAWFLIFAIGGVLIIIGGLWFIIFGSATIQGWDGTHEKKEESENMEVEKLNNDKKEDAPRDRHQSFAVYTN